MRHKREDKERLQHNDSNNPYAIARRGRRGHDREIRQEREEKSGLLLRDCAVNEQREQSKQSKKPDSFFKYLIA